MSAPAPDAIAIRPGERADVPLILSFIRELADYERLSQELVATEALLERHLFPVRGPAKAEVLIGELGGRPEGYALFFYNFSTFLGRPGIYLEDVFVRPHARGRGLGAAMLGRLAALALEQGCARLEWVVLDWNQPAIDFYRSIGAQPMDQWTVNRLTGDSLERLALRSPPVKPPVPFTRP
jgi:GNAT superfamily N-acetyltransferase